MNVVSPYQILKKNAEVFQNLTISSSVVYLRKKGWKRVIQDVDSALEF